MENKKYTVVFYKDRNDNAPIVEYIDNLRMRSCTNKNAKINFNKIIAYIDLLEKKGAGICEPWAKHLDGDIWELRPLRNRILYAHYKNNEFIILHYFIKKTQKLPRKELEQAKRNLADYKEREKQ